MASILILTSANNLKYVEGKNVMSQNDLNEH